MEPISFTAIFIPYFLGKSLDKGLSEINKVLTPTEIEEFDKFIIELLKKLSEKYEEFNNKDFFKALCKEEFSFNKVSEIKDTFISIFQKDRGNDIYDDFEKAIIQILSRDKYPKLYEKFHFSLQIETNKIVAELRKKLFPTEDWGNNKPLIDKINGQNREALVFLNQNFICNNFIERSEVKEVFKLLEEEDIVLLSGEANSGKSSIIYEVLNQSIDEGYMPYILKIDQLNHIKSKYQLKTELELPDTPEKTLANISKNSKGLLIIDQLDAVSHYSGRNAETYDNVVFSIINNSRQFSNLRVLIACRSVDLKNDFRFKKLIEEEEKNVINVSSLSEKVIIETLEQFSVTKKELNDKQIEFLKNPLALYLQTELLKVGTYIEFNSLSQLYGKYWERKQIKFLEEFESQNWKNVLSYISNYMSSKKLLFIPESKLEDYKKEVNKLLTESILKKLGKKIYFFHESFFDYTFARLFSDGEQDICDYLLENDQFLFRRAQVRQVLTYKKEEEDPEYYTDVDKIIRNTHIRYHIKDLVFRFLNFLNTPSIEELNILKKYLFNEKNEYFEESWRVLISKKWIHLLQEKKFFQLFNKEKNEEVLKKAIKLMIGFSPLLKKEELDVLIEIYERYDSLKELIARELFENMSMEKQEQLELYGHFLEKGFFEIFLFNLNTYNINEENEEIFILWLDKILRYYFEKSKIESKEIFELLPNNLNFDRFLEKEKILPFYSTYIDVIDLFLEYSQYLKTNSYYERFSYRDSPKEEIFNAFINCFVELSKRDKALAKIKIDKYLRYKNKNYDRLVFEIYKKTSEVFKEELIELLLKLVKKNDKTLDLETYEYYLLMKEVSKNFSSIDIKKLEAILTYYPNWEKPNKRSYEELKPSSLGYSQLYILSGLDKRIISTTFNLRLEELQRKFPNENIEEYVRQRQKIMFSSVPSPIKIKNLKLMNDVNLLKFIDKYNKADMGINYDIDQLSWDLKKLAQEDPNRFFNFVKKLPLETYKSHVSEIIFGLAESNSLSSQNVKDILEYIFNNFKDISGGCVAKILENYSEINYSGSSMKCIEYFAIDHSDPVEDYWKKNINGSAPYTAGINSSRGQIARAIGELLKNNPSYLVRFEPIVRKIIQDKTTAVKSCTIDILIAYYNNDKKEFALNLLKEIIDSSDEELLKTNNINEFLNHIFYNHFEEFKYVLYKMLNSNNSKIKENGALHIGKLFLNKKGEHENLLEYCYRKDDLDIEKGLAKVFATNIINYKEVCNTNLKKLFNSEFKDVRSEASRFYNQIKSEELENFIELYRSYISSSAFRDNVNSFLYNLDSWDNITFEIPDFIFEISEKVFSESIDNKNNYYSDKLLRLICKIYEESREDELIEKCLDLIDVAFKSNIYKLENVLSDFERK